MLQINAIRTQERESHVSRANEQDIYTTDWEERSSLHGRHVGKEHLGGQPSGRPQGNFRYLSLLYHEAESEQMCI